MISPQSIQYCAQSSTLGSMVGTVWSWQASESFSFHRRATAEWRRKDIESSTSFFPVTPGISGGKRDQLYDLADEILVNDSIVDNRLLGSETRCYLRWELGRSSGEEEMYVVRGQQFWPFLAPQVVCQILWGYFLLLCAVIVRNVLQVRCTYGEGSTIPVSKHSNPSGSLDGMGAGIYFVRCGYIDK